MTQPSPSSQPWFIRMAIVVVFFAAVAPTLAWLDFYHAEENVVIATAMEMRRTAHWLIPTLQEKSRTIKPPLTVWMTAAAIRPSTLAQLNDPATRDAALRKLAFEARWPTLLMAALMLVAVYELGRALEGPTLGLISACVCGTTWFFILRQGPKTTTDLQLAFWVTVTNAFLARAITRGQSHNWIFAGAALGMSLMSKGPVALLQTIVPVLLFLAWRRSRPRISLPAMLLGVALMLIIGLWWYVLVLLRAPGTWQTYFAEITRYGANELRPDAWHHYIRALRFFFPWLIWLIIGIVWGVRILWERKHDDRLLAFFFFLVPLVVMNMFEERKERYLIPLIAPAAVLAGYMIRLHLVPEPRWKNLWRFAAWFHWIGLAVLAVGLPIVGAWKLQTARGSPWFAWSVAIPVAAAMAVIIGFGIWIYRNHRSALVATTVAVMLVTQALYQAGFRKSDAGLSDMRGVADEIIAKYPDAEIYSMYFAEKPGIVFTPGVDLSIYTNRTVKRVQDVANIPVSDRSQVILAVNKEREPVQLPSEPWREFHKVERHNQTWHLLVRK